MSPYDELKYLIIACLAAGVLPKDIFTSTTKVVLVEGKPVCKDQYRLADTLRNISLGNQTGPVTSRFKECLGMDVYAALLTGKFGLQKVVPAAEVAPVIELPLAGTTPRKRPPSPRKKSATVTEIHNSFSESPASA